MREWWSKIRATLTGRRAVIDDLGDEISANLEFEIEENVANGMTPEEARAKAIKHFGNLTLTQERAREAWSFPRFETLFQDIRYGLRGIRRSKAFSIVVILTLALGIGATTGIFSVVYSALLRPLPYPSGERLVWLGEATPKAQGISVTWVNYQHWRNENHSFESMAAYRTGQFTLTGRGEALFTRAGLVTSSFLPMLGKQAMLGRLFDQVDDRVGAAPTVVLSHAFWIGKLGGNPQVVGSTLDLDGKAYQVIGVLPPGPVYFSSDVDFFIPLALSDAGTVNRAKHGSTRVLGLLRPGVTLAAAHADLNVIMQRLEKADPGPENGHRAYGEFLTDSNTNGIKPTLFILICAVALVLLIACANVASLLMARGAARSREITIRTAIGAGRGRLVRQLLTESLLLASSGGALGVLLAHWCLLALISMGPRNIPRISEIGLDVQVLLFAASVTLLTGLVVGVAPVFITGRLNLTRSLNENSRSVTGTRTGQSFRSALVVAEIAITLVLCFASGLLLRSLIAAQTAYPGFAADHVLELELALPASGYKNADAIRRFYDTLVRDLSALPGVTNVGAVHCPPSAGDCGDWFYSVLDKPRPAQGEVPIALFNTADPVYFRTMHIPMRQGREFRDTDDQTAPLVAVVNEEFAHQWWPNESSIGRQIKVGGPYLSGPTLEIVGVAANVSQMGLDSKPLPEIYQPLSQSASSAMVTMIRSSGDIRLLAPAVRHRVAQIDRNLAVQNLRPFERRVAATLDRRRFVTALLTLFAALAIVLATVGVYGILNYWVRVREADIAIRMALGAERGAIVRWVGGQAVRLAAAGILIGVLAGWGALRWIESLVFGVSARNPATMALAALVVIGFAMLAAVLPAWRAARVDTLQTLHCT